MMDTKRKHIIKLAVLLVGVILLNVLSNYYYKRFDLTQDNRYTLSNASKNVVSSLESPLVVDVFLEGDFPPEFRKLRSETKQLLEEFSASNSNIRFEFINPIDGEDDPDAIRQQLANFGLTAAQVEVQENGKTSTELVYPWALAYFNEQTIKIPPQNLK